MIVSRPADIGVRAAAMMDIVVTAAAINDVIEGVAINGVSSRSTGCVLNFHVRWQGDTAINRADVRYVAGTVFRLQDRGLAQING